MLSWRAGGGHVTLSSLLQIAWQPRTKWRDKDQDRCCLKRNKSGCGLQQLQTICASFHLVIIFTNINVRTKEQIKVAHGRTKRPIYIHTYNRQTYRKGTFYWSIKPHHNKIIILANFKKSTDLTASYWKKPQAGCACKHRLEENKNEGR